ncbi:fumarate hydratase C-terminal domain-containing protein [Pseudomonas flavocrustae]|uniref:fumarate hydratase C-terminal domain-containing protein n=1 Tax=Pseudomonas flavocrustae TaxID=2991719 RepID=UPI003D66E904
MQRVGCVYLAFLGGGYTLLSYAIKAEVQVGWPELLTQYRLSKIRVRSLGAVVVAIDAHGKSLYAETTAQAGDNAASGLSTWPAAS